MRLARVRTTYQCIKADRERCGNCGAYGYHLPWCGALLAKDPTP